MALFFKIVLIGDPAVGKTSIQRNYFGQSFQDTYIQTLGADFAVKKVGEDTFQIWDLAGQINYDIFRKQYFRGTKGAIIVYDVSDKKSLRNINFWYDEVLSILDYEIPVTVVGNKIDLRDDKVNCISTEEGMKTVSKILDKKNADYEYMESSALTGLNVPMLFKTLLDRMTDLIEK